MADASRGDDVYGVSCVAHRGARPLGEDLGNSTQTGAETPRCPQEDQATNEFLERMAKLTGKEAAMFAVSGTMSVPRRCSLITQGPSS